MKAKIYTLRDPRNNDIRYVGLTVESLERRLYNHISSAENTSNKKIWINELLKENIKPVIEIVEEVDVLNRKDAEIIEQSYIFQFRGWGFNLLNQLLNNSEGVSNYFYGKKLYGDKNGNYKNYRTKENFYKLTYEGVIVKEYSNMNQIENDDLSPSTVYLCLSGKRTQHKGFQFILKSKYKSPEKHLFKPSKTQKKTVYAYSKENKFLGSYESTQEASMKVYGNKDGSKSISAVCLGKRKSHKGFKWSYTKIN